ncbi:MAG: formate C-acetyltransferase [Parabacteroides sp.]|jgi:formate C-acetyltransferase|uniref:Formate acetyltransferase n=4 Tax=Bacteroidales TaxID=171549 RepID=A0A1T5CGS0_9BACT|nr:formate C-acetyltransferase [Parabacteroides chartae]MBP7871676.1 formate C-acetyltransferase [Parabacteroides sp.]HML69731.1 formate C-acetyltransferase [Macellibacteroides fermentans]MBP7939471.1 formate C-acetyltransferase [Parabacteroides sp.]MBP8012271.1 formate C-acetyltransferase [Parabacteroides sp.]MDD3254712.1 formate C-acetyltransferase [Parabacteroides sp.]
MELNKNFADGIWSKEVNVRDFVMRNITPYDGDASFLAGPTERTKRIWSVCLAALAEERANNGVRSIDNKTVSTISSHKAGYIDKENELIVGLQTDELLRRAIKPFGGINVVAKACSENGLEVDEKVKDIFTHYRKTHNDGVFDVYNDEIRSFRSLGFLTGLPDNYARGRIIGDYRRLALYGLDRLIEAKKQDLANLTGPMTEARIRLREEVSDQIKALKEIKVLGEYYGLDLTRPAYTAQEAVQWVYMAYLAAVKEQDGAAMSLGNVSSFLDIYIEHDLKNGTIDESFAQELIDQFVIKLRMVRHLRMNSYNEIFAGDPTWVTESIGGRLNDGRHKVTKTSFRFLQTLYNLGPSPEPNMTVLWSPQLPEGFKNFCAQVSIDTSSVQYENDDLMRDIRHSDDYGIACCVSFQDIGRQIQFFGARTNLAKALLLAINGGRCENTGTVMVKDIPQLNSDVLDYEEVMANYKKVLKEIARVYNDAMNIIHYMHDKYYYEKAQMAFIDTNPRINLAYGAAGLSIVADSLSAIKYAKVKAKRNDIGLTEGFDIEGEFPYYGNDDDRVDSMAVGITQYFSDLLNELPVYKNARPTLSILTITSNVMYGKKTGATPDGRLKGVAFAPGANPMHGRDEKGAIASLSSVSKINYDDAQDGVSNTFSIVPRSLGVTPEDRVDNLVSMMDGYFSKKAHHLNVNVLNRAMLEDAMEHPENYPQLTIRVSGYAVNFVRLSREHQLEVLSRSFHERF